MAMAHDVAVLWRDRRVRSLAGTRLLSQAGDGAFQVGIAAAFFFDPVDAATPMQIAVGFAVLLAPFTIVGPFLGPFIDRWSRQRIIVVGSAVRVALVAGVAAAIMLDGPLWSLYAMALAVLSINRLVLAAMTAGLPVMVDDDQLLTANSVIPTLGTVAAALGGMVGAVITFIAPTASDGTLAHGALGTAGVLFSAGILTMFALPKDSMGPEAGKVHHRIGAELAAVARRIGEGARYLVAKRTPAYAMVAMGAQRFLYGMMFVAAILISRHLLTDTGGGKDGLGQFTVVLAFAAVGFGVAALVTPLFKERVSRQAWIVIASLVGASGQVLLAVSTQPWALYAAAVIVSAAVQGGKIAADTIMQHDTADAMRGRAAVAYDMAYNVAFISSALVAGLMLPPTGYSAAVMTVLAVGWVAVGVAYAPTPRVAAPDPAPAA